MAKTTCINFYWLNNSRLLNSRRTVELDLFQYINFKLAWSCAKIHFIKICHRTKCLSAYKYKQIARFHKFKKCPLYSVRRVKSCCRNNIDVLPHIENHWANSTAGTRAKHLKKKTKQQEPKVFLPSNALSLFSRSQLRIRILIILK